MLILLGFIIWLSAPERTSFGDDRHRSFFFWRMGEGDICKPEHSVVDYRINIGWNLRGLAWVIAVMLPPMAIFFPLFTLLGLGYLTRVAFNFHWPLKKGGAHGKQSLTMAMGFGCNAAGVVATRVMNSPRERLIAILTNNFVPCNGRFPTLIMLATVFVAAAFPPALTSFIAAGTVVVIVLIGVAFTFLMSWMLSRTVLKGEASAFTLELPPYRRPNVSRISTLRSSTEPFLFSGAPSRPQRRRAP